ncbi:conserved hypothetical protein (DUF2177, membrane protein) [Alteracholeplasma palmae J233]|uniref:DUF2177 domain-containing protein n=1 Tax=Alteracholeplasma palmae (strain ATCC 49389 / J233) TaxID=1318466 RepID=U4KRK8_ALTPJ|nr:DUF2177 family protein [Alteracholeplasma palmae]CCV64256.1 conserved hypothetical protein (DUF2177, membrane protein) [Alteracholeplasma palmae J233]
MSFLKLFGISVLVFFVIDIIWLALISRNLYQSQIGFLMKEKVNWAAAIIFYFIFIAGMTYLILMPSVEHNYSYLRIMITGAVFGLVCYATYDLTNLATLKDWPLKITIIDLIWGTTLGSVTSLITIYLYKLITK